ncbi:TauD/TfdA family dioxygenase [Kitasatospora sp. NPDC093806]|uniref:TauD/TfdA dioxygenase family protein n=1 Tax=Kitasatospora sp. NPDC093806 TaxID=3155075 RepID=UPI00342D3DB3
MTDSSASPGFVAELSAEDERRYDPRALVALLRRYAVLVLRGMTLTPAEQVELTRGLGEPLLDPDTHNRHPDRPEVFVVDNSGATPVVGNNVWHTDGSFLPRPVRYTMLRAVTLPPSGGDTLYADLQTAYEKLPARWRDALAGATGLHTYDRIAARRAEAHRNPAVSASVSAHPPVRHPVVRAHPDTGAPVLFVNDLCLARIESGDGAPVEPSPADLVAHATRDEFVHRHRWEPGDVVVWDNARALHRSDFTTALARVMHRTTTEGDVPCGYGAGGT